MFYKVIRIKNKMRMTRTDEDAMKSALLFSTPWGAGGGL